MADFCDIATDVSTELTAQAIQRHRSRSAEPFNNTGDCVDCGGEIPAARRQSLPGVLRCVDCQVLHEGRK